MPKGIKYDDYFVAFLDILGFKNLVTSKSASDVYKMFLSIMQTGEMIKGVPYQRSPFKNIEKHTSFSFFSDSIICAIPSKIPNAFSLLTSHCMMIQHGFWLQSNPVWVRGAIAKGNLFCKDNVIFGPALIDAYRVEETLAKYPRIVMTQSTYNEGIKNLNPQEEISYIVSTEDGLKMVEALKYFGFPHLKKLRKQIEEVISEEKDVSVREKYLWIKNHFNSFVDEKSRLKPFRRPIE